jgi:ribosomal protein S14
MEVVAYTHLPVWPKPSNSLFFLLCPHVSLEIHCGTSLQGGTRWRGWLRHCATSPKVAGSIPDAVVGIFHRRNPSGRNMALVSTQPLTGITTRCISCGQRQPVRRDVNFASLMCRLSLPPGALRAWPGLYKGIALPPSLFMNSPNWIPSM